MKINTLTYDSVGNLYGTYPSLPLEGYDYYYKDNAAQDIDYIMLGNLKVYNLKDVYGRIIGKEIKRGSSVLSGEYISYLKAGDHATNMPATVWFADGTKIKDSIKYSYDNCGNIIKITENGHVAVKYEYD
ncbi:MAG: hypothetical protein NC131_18775, partial [Roseburia sp.]|nr:hypothetical protein [Roseburia sp.]